MRAADQVALRRRPRDEAGGHLVGGDGGCEPKRSSGTPAMQEAPGDVAIAAAWSYLLNYLDVSPNDAATACAHIGECIQHTEASRHFVHPARLNAGYGRCVWGSSRPT